MTLRPDIRLDLPGVGRSDADSHCKIPDGLPALKRAWGHSDYRTRRVLAGATFDGLSDQRPYLSRICHGYFAASTRLPQINAAFFGE